MNSQIVVLVALIVFVVLGLGGIALLAVLNSRKQDEAEYAEPSPAEIIERAIQQHREHAFLQKYPEWEGRDFRTDSKSPWHTDPAFAAAESHGPLTS